MTRLLIVGIACWTLVTDQERPTFRLAARTVYIYATVQGHDGRLVTNLTRDDFEVFDDNQPQAITVFDNTPQKITVAVMFDMSNSMAGEHPRIRAAGDRAGAGALARRSRPHRQLRNGGRDQPVPHQRQADAAAGSSTRSCGPEGRRRSGTRSRSRWTRSTRNQDGASCCCSPTATTPRFSCPGSLRRGSRHGRARRLHDLRGRPRGQRHDRRHAQPGGGYRRRPLPRSRANDDLGKSFAQVVEELHHQYVIGFSTEATDGRSHKLTDPDEDGRDEGARPQELLSPSTDPGGTR